MTERTKEAIQKAPPPRDVPEVRSFLGLRNVYRKFVKDFTKIATPLNKKLNKGQPTKWESLTDEEMTAFETLKDKLVKPPILTLPKANRPLILDTDACDHQLGCVLLQKQEDAKTWLPLGFWSRTLSSAEKNYDTTNKECLAVVWAVLSLRPYLEGTRFLIRTDHDALKCCLLYTSDAADE